MLPFCAPATIIIWRLTPLTLGGGIKLPVALLYTGRTCLHYTAPVTCTCTLGGGGVWDGGGGGCVDKLPVVLWYTGRKCPHYTAPVRCTCTLTPLVHLKNHNKSRQKTT